MKRSLENWVLILINENRLTRAEIMELTECSPEKFARALRKHFFALTDSYVKPDSDKMDINEVDHEEMEGVGVSFKTLFTSFDKSKTVGIYGKKAEK